MIIVITELCRNYLHTHIRRTYFLLVTNLIMFCFVAAQKSTGKYLYLDLFEIKDHLLNVENVICWKYISYIYRFSIKYVDNVWHINSYTFYLLNELKLELKWSPSSESRIRNYNLLQKDTFFFCLLSILCRYRSSDNLFPIYNIKQRKHKS